MLSMGHAGMTPNRARESSRRQSTDFESVLRHGVVDLSIHISERMGVLCFATHDRESIYLVLPKNVEEILN